MATIYLSLYAPMSEIRLITILPAHYGRSYFPVTQNERNEAARRPDLVHCRLENVCLDDSFLVQEDASSRSGIWPADVWVENRTFGQGTHRRINWRYTWGDFVALSYTWGDPDDTCDIVVNGQIARVTRNLESALRVLRDKAPIQAGCKLWVDAICIHQENLVEKGREIGRMRSIYQKAADVVVWLGAEADDSGMFLDFVNALSGCFEVGQEERLRVNLAQQLKVCGPGLWQATTALMSRAYWSRLWVVQEIAMGSRHTPLLCGKRAIRIDDLDKTLYYFNNPPEDSITAAMNQVFDDLQLSYWELESARPYWVWDVVRSLRGYQQIREAGALPELGSLLRYCRTRQASELKDKVYGLMALLDASIASRITIDYTLPAAKLLISFAQICIEETKSLETFSECGGWGRKWANEAYPSWVPDYTNKRFRALTAAAEPNYNAGGSLVASSTLFSHEGTMLTCRGVRVDVLDGVSSGYWWLRSDGSPNVEDQYEGDDIPIEDSIVQPVESKHAYGTEEALADAVWRTLVGNRHLANFTPDPAPNHWVGLLNVFAGMEQSASSRKDGPWCQTLSFIRRNADFMVGGQPLSTLFSRQGRSGAEGPEASTPGAMDDAITRISRFALFRKLVTTKNKGLVGMAPHWAAPGDAVYCFPGSSLPMLLREVPCEAGGEGRKTYKIVTPIYIHGVMQGEAFSQGGEDALEEVTIW